MIQARNNLKSIFKAYKANTANKKPKKLLPTSPIKILAFGKFHTRKPQTIEVIASNIKLLMSYQLYNKARLSPTDIASILAMPLIPSIKLYKLSSQTKKRIARMLVKKPKFKLLKTETWANPSKLNTINVAVIK
ncbi:hypothetical protein MASRES_GEN12896_17940 [Acinetobacter baumannii]